MYVYNVILIIIIIDKKEFLTSLINGTVTYAEASLQASYIKAKDKIHQYLIKDVPSDTLATINIDPIRKHSLNETIEMWSKVLVDSKEFSGHKLKKTTTTRKIDRWRPTGWAELIESITKPPVESTVDVITNPLKVGLSHRFVLGMIQDLTQHVKKDHYGMYIYH